MGWTGGRGNLDKMPKNCMKITKSAFLGKNNGEHGGTSQFSGQCG